MVSRPVFEVVGSEPAGVEFRPSELAVFESEFEGLFAALGAEVEAVGDELAELADVELVGVGGDSVWVGWLAGEVEGGHAGSSRVPAGWSRSTVAASSSSQLERGEVGSSTSPDHLACPP